jgi:hypothetical protein
MVGQIAAKPGYFWTTLTPSTDRAHAERSPGSSVAPLGQSSRVLGQVDRNSRGSVTFDDG